MNKSVLMTLCVVLMSSMALTSCTTSRTTRTDTGGARDLSGKWNAQDAKLTAVWIKESAVSGAWVDNHIAETGKKPLVRVGNITVQSTGEVISTKLFVNEIRMALINSGRVRVRSGQKSSATRAILKDQDRNASDATRKEAGEEHGADYLLTGSIVMQFDQSGRHKDKTYAVDMELRHIQTQEIIWVDRKEINKQVDRRLFH